MRLCQSPDAVTSNWRITSVSDEVWRPTPASSRLRRSCGELTRLPLWATASGPSMVSITWGCMLRSPDPPVVL